MVMTLYKLLSEHTSINAKYAVFVQTGTV